MERKVRLAIEGLQFDGPAETESMRTVTEAEYFERGGVHYLVFEELQEGFSQPTRNMLKLKAHSLELSKKGVVNVHMTFIEHQRTSAVYGTPFGEILLGIETEGIAVEQEPEKILAHVSYRLWMNEEYLAECRLTIEAVPYGKGPVLLV